MIGCLRQRILERSQKRQRLSGIFFGNIYYCIQRDSVLESRTGIGPQSPKRNEKDYMGTLGDVEFILQLKVMRAPLLQVKEAEI